MSCDLRACLYIHLAMYLNPNLLFKEKESHFEVNPIFNPSYVVVFVSSKRQQPLEGAVRLQAMMWTYFLSILKPHYNLN